MNAMLDGYPEEYEGYLIRTDFRIGMQICLCLEDRELEEYERLAIALDLLFGKGMPDMEVAMKALSWYINGGKLPEKKAYEDNGEEEDEEEENRYFDFEIDSDRIITAFQKAYGIDITKTNMHWFRFLALLGDVGECAFTNVVNIRTKKLTSNMSSEQRATYAELKRKYSLVSYTEDEQAKIESFFAELSGSNK